MPRPLDLELLFTEGKGKSKRRIKVADERKWLFGSIEGRWWPHYSWWVIPLGLTLLITPWLFLARGCGSPSNLSHAPLASPSAQEDEAVYRSTVVLSEGEDDEETYRSSVRLPQ